MKNQNLKRNHLTSASRRLLSVFASVAMLAGGALAQDGASLSSQRQAARVPVVTASASASGVRFVAPGETRRMRLEVYSAVGERLFDSEFRQGGILDWDGQGLQGEGSYLCVVTVEDLQGKLSRKLSSVSSQGGRVSTGREDEETLKSAYAQALSAAGLARGDADAATPTAIVTKSKEPSLTVAAHDGQDGQVTATTGALTFRTGNVFAGTEKEQMRVTPEGMVGIGTDKPEATLDVAGTIRARGGIRFDDGTVLTSAGAPSQAVVAAANTTPQQRVGADGTIQQLAAGAGTANQLSKWLDNAGTLGDSVISEKGGKVGIGTNNPQASLDVGGKMLFDPASQLFVMGNNTGNPQIIFDYPLATGGSDFTARASGSQQLSFGFNNQAIYGGASQTAGGRLMYFYDRVAGAYRGGFNGSGDWYWGPSPTNYAFKVEQPGSSLANFTIKAGGNVGVGTTNPSQKLEVAGSLKLSGAGSALIFPDGTTMTTATTGGGGPMSGTAIVNAINDPSTANVINDNRLSGNLARLGGANLWTGANTFGAGLSANNAPIVNVGNPVNAGDAVNKSYVDASTVKFVPGAEQLSVGDANGTAPMINLRGGSTCCSGPGGHTPAFYKVFQNGSFVATGNLGIGVSPMQGKGYRTSWDSYKGAFRSGYADNEWDDATVGFFSWAGGSNSTAEGLYALAFGDTNFARSTSSIAFGSGNEVKGAAGFSAGSANRVCDTYGVAFGNKAQSGGPLINGKCDPDTFNIRGLAAVAMGFNVTADQDHTTALGKFATNNGFSGTFIWGDGSATSSAETFRNTANNEFAARASGGFRFRTNLTGTTGCNLPAGSGVFNCTSTRTTKENFRDVDGESLLNSLRKVPVSTWNYIDEGRGVRHLGPMAEDFHAAFSLGTGNTTIGVLDIAGVNLAAVKALEARTAQLQEKSAEVEQLRSKVSELEGRLAAIEQMLKSGQAAPTASERR